MYQEQRLEKILELLEERKQLSAKEISLANASWSAGPTVGSFP